MNMSTRNFHLNLSSAYRQPEIEYATYPQVQIPLPTNLLVVGSTGSGKTNWVMNFITITNAFTRFILCIKSTEELLYRYFIDQLYRLEGELNVKVLTLVTHLSQLPHLGDIDKEKSTLFICDDMVTESSKDLSKVGEFFIRGRKENCTSVFLSQDFYKVPSLIRNNCRITVICRIDKMRNLKFICKEFDSEKDVKEIEHLYQQATQGGFPNVFLIDPYNTDPKMRYRRNFTPLIT